MHTLSHKAKRIGLSVTLTVVAILSSVWVFGPKPSIEQVARSSAYKAFNGNSNTILNLTPESDLIATKVSKEQWKQFVENELTPRLKKLTISKEKLTMSANSRLIGVFYFVAGCDGMNRDMGVGTQTSGDDFVVPMSVWILLFSEAYSVTDLRISDSEYGIRQKGAQEKSLEVLKRYGIHSIVVENQVRDLSSKPE